MIIDRNWTTIAICNPGEDDALGPCGSCLQCVCTEAIGRVGKWEREVKQLSEKVAEHLALREQHFGNYLEAVRIASQQRERAEKAEAERDEAFEKLDRWTRCESMQCPYERRAKEAEAALTAAREELASLEREYAWECKQRKKAEAERDEARRAVKVAREALSYIAQKDHAEECDYSPADHGEEIEDQNPVCTCCQSCRDDLDRATRALAALDAVAGEKEGA
jgi:hypothetical protein